MPTKDEQGRIVMSAEEIAEKRQLPEYEQYLVEAMNDGTLCWDTNDRRKEPVHNIKKGERLWCWEFQETENGYTHAYQNMGGSNIPIKTDVELKLVYLSTDPDDPELYKAETDKSPNWS